MLYFPWYDEDVDLLGGYATYIKSIIIFIIVHRIVLANLNGDKYTQANIDDILAKIRVFILLMNLLARS